MKRIFLSALIGVGTMVAALQVLSGTLAARTLQSYPLVCRGSESLAIGFAPGETNIGFVFTRGTKPAGAGLAPGQCSWMDRGVSTNEPDKLSQHVDRPETLRAGGTLAPENRWYDELHSPDNYWTFQVYSSGGQMIVTGAQRNIEMSVAPLVKVPIQITHEEDPAVSGPAIRSGGDCGLTLPCGGSVSITSPAFSIVNSRGPAVFAQGGGAGLFGSAIRAKNTNENGIGIWSATASSDANLVLTNTGSGDLMRGFSGGSGGDLVFQVQNNGTTKVKSLEANSASGDASIRGINAGGGGAIVGVSSNVSGSGGRFTNTKGGIALEVLSAGETALDVVGTAEVDVLKIKGGSDLAERFEVCDEAQPGMVVTIDPDHIGRLCIANGPYNRRVIGILSGANNLPTGMILADLPSAKNSRPVALSGRVWVYAEATRKAIEPGDLLTSAHLSGYAMAVTNHVRARGAIIGKAMTGLKHGRGLVLVFVTLQ